MDGMNVIAGAIYTALAASPTLMTLIANDPTRIYRGAASPGQQNKYPYILFSYASGGQMNDAPYDAVDCEFMITGVDTTSKKASDLHAQIELALKNKAITYPDGWVSWSTVRQTDFFSRNVVVQNSEYDQIGAFYRFRASKPKG